MTAAKTFGELSGEITGSKKLVVAKDSGFLGIFGETEMRTAARQLAVSHDITDKVLLSGLKDIESLIQFQFLSAALHVFEFL